MPSPDITQPKEGTATASSVVVLVAWMWIAYFLNYCDRQAVSAMHKVLKSDLSMSDTQFGLATALFLWVYGFGCPIAGFLADRFSKRTLVLFSLIVWSLVTLLTGLSVTAGMLLGMRAAMGISEALFMPAAIALTSISTPDRWRSKAIAGLTTAQIAGIVGGSSFGGWMAERGEWRIAFVILGVCGLLYAIPYGWYLSRNVPGSPNRSQSLQASSQDHRPWDPWFALFRVPTFSALCVIFPMFVFGLWLIYSWLASYMQERFSLSLTEAGWMSMVYLQSATCLGLFTGGYVADRLRSRYRTGRLLVLLGSLLLCVPSLLAIGRVDEVQQMKWVLMAYGFSSGWMMGNIFPAAFEVVPTHSRGKAVGILNLFGAALSGFAPLAVGAWKQSLGLPGMLGVAAIGYGIAAVLLAITIFRFFQKDFDRNAATGIP